MKPGRRRSVVGRLSTRHPGAWVLCLVAAVAGCEPLPQEVGLRITQVLQSDNCGPEQPSAYVIESASQWNSLQAAQSRFLPDPSKTDSGAVQYPALSKDEIMVVVAAGQQPSAGYRVVVDTYDWQRTDDELVLKVMLDSPPEDSMQATVLTSPCSVVAIRNYRGIEQVRFIGLKRELSVQLAGSP